VRGSPCPEAPLLAIRPTGRSILPKVSPISANDAVDGSSSGASAPRSGCRLRLPRLGGAAYARRRRSGWRERLRSVRERRGRKLIRSGGREGRPAGTRHHLDAGKKADPSGIAGTNPPDTSGFLFNKFSRYRGSPTASRMSRKAAGSFPKREGKSKPPVRRQPLWSAASSALASANYGISGVGEKRSSARAGVTPMSEKVWQIVRFWSVMGEPASPTLEVDLRQRPHARGARPCSARLRFLGSI